MKTLHTSKKKMHLAPCSCCGESPERTLVTYTIWISEADSYIFHCKNKKCKWHLSPFIWDRKKYDKWKKRHKIQAEYYNEVMVEIEESSIDRDIQIRFWNKYHNSKPKTKMPEADIFGKIITIDSLEL